MGIFSDKRETVVKGIRKEVEKAFREGTKLASVITKYTAAIHSGAELFKVTMNNPEVKASTIESAGNLAGQLVDELSKLETILMKDPAFMKGFAEFTQAVQNIKDEDEDDSDSDDENDLSAARKKKAKKKATKH